jgi:hypothetical protein
MQQHDGLVDAFPIGEQPSDGADSRPPAGGCERLKQCQRCRLPVQAIRGSGFGESAGAEPVTAGGCLAQDAVVAVLVK